MLETDQWLNPTKPLSSLTVCLLAYEKNPTHIGLV